MNKIWIVVLLILMVIPLANGAEIKILDITQMPQASYTGLSLEIWFEVENTGYENVLITFPSDFTIHSDKIDGAQGEAVISKSESLLAFRAKYGDTDDRYSFISTHLVFESDTPISRGASVAYTELGETRRGWFIRPNERLIGHIKVTSSGTGTIDPFSLEENLPFIEVTKFRVKIKFTPTPNIYGFIQAPYVVKDVTLISSYPSIFADGNDFDASEYYWELFKPSETEEETREINVVDWDDWFATSSSPMTISSVPMTPTLITSTDLEYYPIEKVEKTTETEEVFLPVWYISSTPLIDFVQYEYQWRKNFQITGIYLDNLKEPPRVAAPIPEWNNWF